MKKKASKLLLAQIIITLSSLFSLILCSADVPEEDGFSAEVQSRLPRMLVFLKYFMNVKLSIIFI